MSARPYVSFSEVKAKVSLPDVLDIFKIADGFARQGKTLCGVCPLPQHKHGPQPNREQFKINEKNGTWLWKCFGDCQKGGCVIEFVKAMTGFDNAHVRYWFAEHFADRLNLSKPKNGSTGDAKKAREDDPTKEQSTRAVSCNAATNGNDAAPTATISADRESLKPLRFYLQLDAAVPYLRQRGLLPETIERYGLGLCRKGALSGFIAIPVFDWPQPPGSNPVGYIGRFPGNDYADHHKTRYKVPAGFETSRVVYGLPQALQHSPATAPLILVEGAFKVYHLVQAGFPSAVSSFTASLSEEQAAILIATGRPVVLFFDGNEAGYAGMRSAAGKLIAHAYVRAIKLSQDCEPDDLSGDDLRQLLTFVP